MIARIAALVAGLLAAGCSVIGDRRGTEEPDYQVVARQHAVEIRRYGARVAAETTVEGDEEAARTAGFRRLAGYIFGANQGGEKIAMTAPVAQQGDGAKIAMTAPVAQARDAEGRWVIRFFMPGKWTMATLPVPNDPAVRLVPVPPATMAVLRFSGSRGSGAVAERRRELLAALEGSAWQPVGAPVNWFYDPPWTLPWLRRNEVAVPVAAR